MDVMNILCIFYMCFRPKMPTIAKHRRPTKPYNRSTLARVLSPIICNPPNRTVLVHECTRCARSRCSAGACVVIDHPAPSSTAARARRQGMRRVQSRSMGFYLFWLKYKFSRSFSLSREIERKALSTVSTLSVSKTVERRVSCTPYAR